MSPPRGVCPGCRWSRQAPQHTFGGLKMCDYFDYVGTLIQKESKPLDTSLSKYCYCEHELAETHLPGESPYCTNAGWKVKPPVAEYPEPASDANGSAWAQQHGGSHYKDLAVQPSEFILRNELNWLAGNVVKYVSRYNLKGTPVDDLKKAKHYIELLIEEEEKKA